MPRAFALLLCMGLPMLVSAQTVLPDLAPREVEIRGELTIAFPSLRRQPLIGFNPPPRVPEINIRRMPFVEPYKQQGAVLPQNPLGLPVAPTALPRPSGKGFSGLAEAGGGRYGTRYAALETTLRATGASRWTVQAAYNGTSSFSPFGADVSADGVRGATRYSVAGRRVSFGAEAGGSSDSYNLYGVSDPGRPGTLAAPDRVRNDLSARVWIGTGSSAAVHFRSAVSLFAGDISTRIFETRTDPRTEQRDSGLKADLSLGSDRFEVHGSVAQTNLGSASSDRAIGSFHAGGVLRFDLAGGELQIGGRVMGFEASPDATQALRRQLTYLAPTVRFQAAPAPNLRLEISQEPGIDDSQPALLYRSSPYLADEPHIEPVLNVVNARARVRGFWRTFQASGFASFKQSPNWRIFQHDATPFAGYARGFSSITHTKARTVALGGELRFSPRPGFEARLSGQVQDGRMTDLEADIPYFPSWAGSGLLSAAFANRKGLFQVTTQVLGPRERDQTGSTEVPTYFDVDVRVSFSVTPQALLALEVRNLLGDAPYWDHYPEAAGTILLGVGWRW